MQSQLFDNATKTSNGIVLRDYQAEDCDEVCRLWDAGSLRVLCVEATGLGKGIMCAALAIRKPSWARALVVVDSTDLAIDLYRKFKRFTGRKAGILTGDYKEDWEDNDVLIATKQCLCAGDRYLSIDFGRYERFILDECESSLANEYVLMVSYILQTNPQIKLCGLTATPLPSRKRKITDLFSHAATQPGPLYRDLQWGYLNGWLVKPMQGVLRCSLDFSTLKIRKQENGERDYSDQDIAKLMLEQEERHWLELAGGIYQITKGHTAIVVCPNSTVVCDRLAGYIEGHARAANERGVAYAVHRGLGRRRSWDLLRRFKRGEYPVMVSVRMVEKGFDYDRVNMVIMVRRTKSLRLYTQISGRGTRPLLSLQNTLAEYPDPKERMRIIAESDKPSCVVVDCVGSSDDAKDILGVIDILGRGVRDDIKERVRRMMLDRARQQMLGEPLAEGEAAGVDVGTEARKAIVEIREEWEREQRSRVSADVDVTYRVGEVTRSKPRPIKKVKQKRGSSSIKQVKLLIALGANPETALGYSKKQAGQMISWWKEKGSQSDWNRVRQWERSHHVFS